MTKPYLLSSDASSALLMAMRDACGYQPALVLYGLDVGDSVPLSPDDPEQGVVLAEGQPSSPYWSGVGGPYRSDNSGGIDWTITPSASGRVEYARLIDQVTRECHLQSLVGEGERVAGGPAVYLDDLDIVAGVSIEVAVTVVIVAHPSADDE